ncbi:MAG TPA: ABC transporter ATP-binding protein [candidate division Zixibacteria bacterium]|nr:ABC transporter ATP-binding protein [candidate division Zixibacteria bacterium]
MNEARSEARAPVVVAAGVCKSFGARVAVDNLSLEVPARTCFGLLGPNGAGKTTTLRMIYGVTRATRGTIRVFGMDIGREPRRVRRRLGVTLQQNVLLEALSPRENLRVFGRYHLLAEPELSRRAEELIEFLELGSHADTPVRHLSGGFQRRLAIAMSLMNRPELLILDEPTTGLDPAVRLALWSRIRELRAAGTTVLLTTHYMDEAQRLCDSVAIIAGGRVIGEGAPADLIASRLAPEAVEFECSRAEESVLLDGLEGSARRLRAGNRLMLYVEDAALLIERIRRYDRGDRRPVIVRPTNLEDVFLALTGTSLEGGA